MTSLCMTAGRLATPCAAAIALLDTPKSINADIRSAPFNSIIAEEPLQTVAAASENIQIPEDTSGSKPAELPSEVNATSSMQEAQQTGHHTDMPETAARTSKLFASAGHQVTSVVADDDDADTVNSAEHHTVSTAPYDELD